MAEVAIDGVFQEVRPNEHLIDLVNRAGGSVPYVCYHPQLGPVQTCDACMVEVDGRPVRACATEVSEGMRVSTKSAKAAAAQVEALIASSATTCSTAWSATTTTAIAPSITRRSCWPLSIRKFHFGRSATRSIARIRCYDPDQCILCGRCVEACQNVEVNETLSINWKDANPRVLWNGGSTIGESSCVSCGHCVTVCPCNALTKKPCWVMLAFSQLSGNLRSAG